MYKKSMFLALFFSLILICSCSSVYASNIDDTTIYEETISEGSGLIWLSCHVPEEFTGTVKVVLNEVNTQEEIPFFLCLNSHYYSLESLPYGTYKVSSIIAGGKEIEYFEANYSSEPFTVSETDKKPINVPIYLSIPEEDQGTNDNKYQRIISKKVMDESTVTDINSYVIDDSAESITDGELILNKNQITDESEIIHEEAIPEDSGWIRLSCRVPEGFPGTVKIVLYEETEQKEIPFFLRSDTEFSSLEPLRLGTYKIAAVTVSGEAEGCFETGFSTEAFTVSETDEKPIDVPIYLGIAEEMQGADDNKYLGMTYEEIMAEMKGSTINTELDVFNDSTAKEEPVIKGDSEEEYYENVKEYVEEKTEQKKLAEEESRSLLFSIGVTLSLLFGLGIVFYQYKQRRDL